MNITNKQIRSRARYFLDDNIFGKDWIKSVFLTLILTGLVSIVGTVLLTIANSLIIPTINIWLDRFFDTTILLYIIDIIIIAINILILNVFIGPLGVGLSAVHLDLIRGDGKIRIGKFFSSFKNFVDNFQLGFMYMLHSALWSILFFIPGVYVSYSYAMIFYVKHDNPDFTWQQCFDESERLMEGNRWRLFKLQLSFIGWEILGAIAFFGIGSLWVSPYQNVSMAIFYEEIKYSKEELED